MQWLVLTAAMLAGGCSDCPVLHLDRGKLVWDGEPVGEPALGTIEIENLCADDAPVEITAQLVYGEPFSLRDDALVLESDTPVVLEVVFTPPDTALHTDTLLLFPEGLDQVEIALAGQGAE